MVRGTRTAVNIPTLTADQLTMLHDGDLVDVYWNLHKHLYSVRSAETGRVVAHTHGPIVLADATFKVSEAGRQRVLSEGHKNVHAVVRGRVATATDSTADPIEVSYNPYKGPHFYERPTGLPMHAAATVTLDTAHTQPEAPIVNAA